MSASFWMLSTFAPLCMLCLDAYICMCPLSSSLLCFPLNSPPSMFPKAQTTSKCLYCEFPMNTSLGMLPSAYFPLEGSLWLLPSRGKHPRTSRGKHPSGCFTLDVFIERETSRGMLPSRGKHPSGCFPIDISL